MARLPKFLNVSLLRRMRLELPAAKVVLIAFSATLTVVGVGAFVATLPTLTAGVAPVAPETEGGAVAEGAIADQAAAPAATTDAAATIDGGAEASGVAGAGAVGVSSRPPRGNSSASSSSSSNSGSGSVGNSSSAPSDGASSGSSSDSSSDSGGGSSENDDNPFTAKPTEADEQNFHSFLCGWYNKLGDYEAMAAEGNSDPIWGGYIGVRDYTHSNYSKWCGSWGKLVAAYRCLASYAESDEESGKESYYSEYLNYKAAVNL
ncbi:MAG: hypothetical protein SOX20_04230 [Parolsenella sp.]|uniref:hypothetical protein n=1 Tax=Parolsenella sp. TaxID=2083006 RepID=UPI002A75E797|nr:hypothetical protein [Parolsenella sp.]MCI5949316.1 hypothetical protein [Coriobacteriaceae bacterium]MDY3292118.1 hypothetical protein [Parolsenella sp.]